VAAVLDDLAELVVQRLDRVGDVDDLADLGEKARNGMNRSQARSRACTVAGLLAAQVRVGEGERLVLGGVGGRRGVDGA